MSPPPDVGFGDLLHPPTLTPSLDSWAYYLANIWWQSGQMGHDVMLSAAASPANMRTREAMSHSGWMHEQRAAPVASWANQRCLRWPLVFKVSCKIPNTSVYRWRCNKGLDHAKKISICTGNNRTLTKLQLKWLGVRSLVRFVVSFISLYRFLTHIFDFHFSLKILALFWICIHSTAAWFNQLKTYIFSLKISEKIFSFFTSIVHTLHIQLNL